MDRSYEENEQEETTSLISTTDNSSGVRDTREPHQKKQAIYFILASTLFERIGFYCIVANIVLSLRSNTILQWQYSNTLIATSLFTGTSYIATVTFAIISEWKLGRVRTILVGFFLYITGYILAMLITNHDTHELICPSHNGSTVMSLSILADEPCTKIILPTVVVIAVGVGVVQTNTAVLGAAQSQTSKIKSRYCDKYIVTVNIGSIIARLAISFIQKYEAYHYIGYSVAAGMLLISALIFMAGWRYYIRIKPSESVVISCIPVIINAYRSRRRYRRNQRLRQKKNINFDTSKVENTSTETGASTNIDEQRLKLLDFARISNNGKFSDRLVDGVKSLKYAFVVFAFFIPYWMINNQIYTSFSSQGHYMNTAGDSRMIVWMALSDSVTTIIGILILNLVVYKYVDTRQRATSIITKFIIGMFFACITMCVAGLTEIIRQDHCDESTVGPYSSSSLTIYAQLPQNIGIGLSELFAMVASYEFAFFAAPTSAQSLFVNFRFLSIIISLFLGATYTAIFSENWLTFDFSCLALAHRPWRLYAFFYILGGIQLLFMILFIVCQKKFRIIKSKLELLGSKQYVQQSSTLSTDEQ